MNSENDVREMSDSSAAVSNPDVSIWSVIVSVFTNPKEAFGNYVKKPSILWPLILTVVIAGLVAGLTAKQGAMMQYDMMKNSTVLPAEAIEEMRTNALETNPMVSAPTGAIMVVIVTLISSLIAWVLGSFVLGGKAKYKDVWGVILLGGLIAQLGGLARLPMVFAKDSMLVSYGFAAMMPGKNFTSILYQFAYFADFFAIWTIIVTGIGFSFVFGLSQGKGITIAVLNFLIGVTIAVSLATIGMSFAGVEISFF